MSESIYPVTGGAGGNIAVVAPNNWQSIPVAQRKAVLACHGHGSAGDTTDGTMWVPGNLAVDQIRALADAGYFVFAGNLSGGLGWGCAADMTAVTAIYGVSQAAPYSCQAQVGVIGYSAGGLVALNWAKRNTTLTKAIFLWEPASDLDWITMLDGATGGTYTPAYSDAYAASAYNNNTAGTDASNTTWQSEVFAALGYQYKTVNTVTGGYSGAAVAVPMTETIGPQLPASGTVTVQGSTNITATYTSISGVNFMVTATNQTSALVLPAGSIVVPSAAPTYQTASSGWRVHDEYTTWASFPIEVVHAGDDSTLPPAMSSAFVTGAGASSKLYVPQPVGNHTGVFTHVPVSEMASFFLAHL